MGTKQVPDGETLCRLVTLFGPFILILRGNNRRTTFPAPEISWVTAFVIPTLSFFYTHVKGLHLLGIHTISEQSQKNIYSDNINFAGFFKIIF